MLMGVMWMAGTGLYGAGTTKLGKLGRSPGLGHPDVRMVLVANLPGILTGEWRGAPSAVSRKLAMGVSLLVLAIAGLARANNLRAA